MTPDFLIGGTVFARDHGKGLQCPGFPRVYACSVPQEQRDGFHFKLFSHALVPAIMQLTKNILFSHPSHVVGQLQ